MVRLISLLNEKNHYLEKFFSLNEIELGNFQEGNFDSIESFYQSREKILEIISYMDGEIGKLQVEQDDPFAPSQLEKNQVLECLAVKDEYVKRILAMDLEILACIENAKNGIIRELKDLKNSKKAIGGYKAPQHRNRLNEEA